MLKKVSDTQSQMEFVIIDDLVPVDHILRKIDSVIDFSFILDRTAHLYCSTTDRPPIHPITLFKMLFIGYLFGIRSERQLVKEIEVNVAYRWFLGFGLTDKVPHHSVFSQNRRRRFNDSSVFEEIFIDIVKLGIKHGLVDGKILYSDSTHLKANANKGKFEDIEVEVSSKSYLEDLNTSVDEDRKAHGKKPLPPKDNNRKGGASPKVKNIKSSTTDPDSGFMTRDRKPQGFFYLDHRTVDHKTNYITDVHITPGNVNDGTCYIDRLQFQQKVYGFNVQAAGLDAGYDTISICKQLVDMNIMGVLGYKRQGGKKGLFKKNKFTYNSRKDVYLCPCNKELNYRTTSRDGYKEYKSNPSECKNCPMLSKCTESKSSQKVITRHVWEESKEIIHKNRLTLCGKEIYKRRKETIERSFANAKQLHGYRYAKYRGIERVREQAYLTAIVQNIKKLVKYLFKGKLGKLIAKFIINYMIFNSNLHENRAKSRMFGFGLS